MYDIDKMYLMFPTIKPYIKGLSKLLKDSGLTNKVAFGLLEKEGFKGISFDRANETLFEYLENKIQNEEVIPENLQEFVKTINSILDQKIVSKLKYVNYDNSKPESEQTKGSLQNRLIELYKSVLLNENVIGEVMTPVDFDFIKNDILHFSKSESITNLSIFNQLKDIDTKYDFLAGKSLVGQQANALMDYVLGSLVNATGNNFKVTNFEVPKSNDKLDSEYSYELSDSDIKYYAKELNLNLDQVEKLKSIKINQALSAILNAAVDIAKDPYITRGGWTTMTTNTGNLLLRKGVHPFYVNAFLAQPVIKEYVEFSEQYESSQNQNVSTAEEFIEERFRKNTYDNIDKDNVFTFNLKALRDNILEVDDDFQMSVFSTFLQYQSASKAIKTNIDASKFMVNGVGGSVNSLIISKNAVDSILDAEEKYNNLPIDEKEKFRKNIILGFSSKFTNPNGSESMFSKYYNNIIVKSEQIVKANPKLFLVANDTIQDTFNEISHNVNNEILLNEDLSKQLDKTFYSYIMSGFQPLKLTNQERRDLTLNFPKEFESFKEENEGLYSIIDQMSIKQGDTLQFVGLNNRKKSKEFEDSMINSFLDLLNDNEEFANKFIQYSYLTSGFNNHMSQFFTMIPTQWFNRNNINRYIIDTSFKYDNYEGTNDDNFTDQFYLSNLEDTKLVKNISDGQIQSELRNLNGFLVKKPGKVGYYRIKKDPNGQNPPIYYKLIGYNSNYQGVYTRFIPNINGEYTDIKNLNVKDKKGNRIINFDTSGINLKEPTKGIAGIINKQQLEFFNNEAIYPRDIFYRENIIIKKESEVEIEQEIVAEEVNLEQPVIPLTENFTRNSAEKDSDYLYLFTDNAKRSSGSNSLNNNSPYALKYRGPNPLNYPTMTQAVIRGLDNAFPITTMVDDKRTQWTDDKFEEYKSIIDDEIATIQKSLSNYKGIKFAAQMQFGKGKISNMKESAPKIFEYMTVKLAEIGIDNTGNKPTVVETNQLSLFGDLPGTLDDIPPTSNC